MTSLARNLFLEITMLTMKEDAVDTFDFFVFD